VRKRLLFAIFNAGAIIATPTLGSHGSGAHAAPPPPRVLTGQTPNIVADGGAALRGRHDSHDALTLNIGLGVHEGSALDGIIAAAGDPTSPSYGHYLTNDQYMARFAPTDAEVQAVRDWAAGAGLTVDTVSPDHLLVTVHATTGQVEQALGVTINNYRVPTSGPTTTIPWSPPAWIFAPSAAYPRYTVSTPCSRAPPRAPMPFAPAVTTPTISAPPIIWVRSATAAARRLA